MTLLGSLRNMLKRERVYRICARQPSQVQLLSPTHSHILTCSCYRAGGTIGFHSLSSGLVATIAAFASVREHLCVLARVSKPVLEACKLPFSWPAHIDFSPHSKLPGTASWLQE